MATQHYTFAPSIPAGTAQANPVEVATAVGPGDVTKIKVVTPGSVGTAIAIAIAHEIVIPFTGSQWIASTDDSQNFDFEPEGYPTSGAWSVFGYNTTASVLVWSIYYDVRDIQPPRNYFFPALIPDKAIYAAAAR